ncbi:2Fe-2S iron-sulfur cluster-binding protein [Luminiphilus sp.]|nr:2Fe-2S iron-sulfur cluster-binding protein [Luminiphilus sp.]
MPDRLDLPFGTRIRRDEPVKAQFDGRDLPAFAGDTVASALIASGQWVISRSFKYHRPRGPLSMAGHDANTLIQTTRAPNRLAEELAITDFAHTTAQNVTGSLMADRSAVLDWLGRFLPVGFYYRAFYRPFGIWQWWERVIRWAAGLGVANLSVTPRYTDKQYLFCDLAVIGAGPSGLSAALEAANAGISVLLIDEQPELGGALTYHRFAIAMQTQQAVSTTLIAAVASHPRIRVLASASCNGWFTDHYLPVVQGDRLFKVRAKTVVLATGACEQHVVFRNNDLPGIILCSALERLLCHSGVAPDGGLVVLAGNDQAWLTALTASDAGMRVLAVVDLRESPDDVVLQAEMTRRGIDTYLSATVYHADRDAQSQSLERVHLYRLTGQGEVAEHIDTLDCRVLAMSAGFMPAYQLACQAGGQLRYDDDCAAFALSGLPAGLFLAGSVNSIHTLSAVLADGRNAARSALASLGVATSEHEDAHCAAKVNHPWPIFPHPKGRDFVDFDEDLQVKDIVNATRLGYRDVQLVKRYSTVGMGPSQGRHSALPTARLVARATERTVSETGVTTARPPVKPEALGLIAGRRFHPHRRTAMADFHEQAGAQWTPAGLWARPAFYGHLDSRDRCIADEVRTVREAVGVIDVSTLGGIELRGPDAAEFMNRFYTYGFLKQPVGRTRYAVLVSEQGVVIDDGVAARIADDHFYVTATTGGVDRVYREMLRWNAQWRMNIDVANVTSAFSAINVAGPDSRRVLEALGSSVDLTAEALPYLACREGEVGTVPVRLMRVGFVGELAYELHVPSLFASALWESIMQAGEPWGLRPFGVEAQRLLRLEKGHIIVGQDTDGMTHPGEVGLDWAINRNKPDFVGRRSVDILAKAPLARQLVGFSLDLSAPKPLEGHLVIRAGEIVGNVTSCEVSPSLNQIIGLAYAHPDNANPGDHISIRTEGGVMVQARVEALPFYDRDNERQLL